MQIYVVHFNKSQYDMVEYTIVIIVYIVYI